MAGKDELACAASSVTRLMQTSKTAMTNGNTPRNTAATAILAAIILRAKRFQ